MPGKQAGWGHGLMLLTQTPDCQQHDNRIQDSSDQTVFFYSSIVYWRCFFLFVADRNGTQGDRLLK